MDNTEIENLVKKEFSSYIFMPKESLNEYEIKLKKTFDYNIINHSISKSMYEEAIQSVRKRFAIKNNTVLYELIENEQSSAFYSGFRFGERSSYPILFFKSVPEDRFHSNCGDFDLFLMIYQGINEEEYHKGINQNYKIVYYQSVWAFNDVVYDRIVSGLYNEFYIPRVYYNYV